MYTSYEDKEILQTLYNLVKERFINSVLETEKRSQQKVLHEWSPFKSYKATFEIIIFFQNQNYIKEKGSFL
jgi:hypothetical protein